MFTEKSASYDPELMQKAKQKAEQCFIHNDLSQPFISKLVALCAHSIAKQEMDRKS